MAFTLKQSFSHYKHKQVGCRQFKHEVTTEIDCRQKLHGIEKTSMQVTPQKKQQIQTSKARYIIELLPKKNHKQLAQ